MLPGEIEILAGHFSFDFQYVGVAFQSQLLLYFGLVQRVFALRELFPRQVDHPAVIMYVGIGLHRFERDFIIDQLHVFGTLQPGYFCDAKVVDYFETVEQWQRTGDAVRVIEVVLSGVGVGLGVERSAEVGIGPYRTADVRQKIHDRCEVIAVGIGICQLLYLAARRMFDRIGHTVVQRPGFALICRTGRKGADCRDQSDQGNDSGS